MMEWLQVLVLAVVQGLTEFLPVSSSGHLVVVEGIFGYLGHTLPGDALTLNVALHAGTLAAVLWAYRTNLLRLVYDWRTAGLLIAATFPAVLVGLPLKMFAKEALTSPLLASALLPVTGLMLLWAQRQPRHTGDYTQLSFPQAIAIGIAQAVAILPGISRSGSTIAMGLRMGLKPEAAATFSFLLSIPTIAGACLLELVDVLKKGDSLGTPPVLLAAGAVVSGVVGLGALAWLIRWLNAGKLSWFAWWCIGLGVVAVAAQLALR